MLLKSIKVVTDYCKNCNKQYNYGVPSCCQSCFNKEIKSIKPLSFTLQELAFSCILICPLLYVIYSYFGTKVEILSIFLIIFGQCFGVIINWLMRKF